MGTAITIGIGDKVFAAPLADNATARAFEKLVPPSITMTELNGNEKFAKTTRNGARTCVYTGINPHRRRDAVRLQHAGPVLQVVPNHTQLHENREDRRPCRPGGRTWFRNVAVTFERKREKP